MNALSPLISSLRDLNLSANRLHSPNRAGAVKSLRSLRRLDLSRNGIAIVSHDLFAKLNALAELDLSGNLVQDVSKF